MKIKTSIILSLILLIISCSTDNESQNDNCEIPVNLEVTSTNGENQVGLTWDALDGINLYKIEYGLAGFNQGDGTTENVITPQIFIDNLAVNTAYDFYVSSLCEDGVSDSFGPITYTIEDGGTTSGVMTFMNANIAGTQYNNMVPLLFGVTDATRVVNFPTSDELYLAIQGNSAPQDLTLSNSKEINIFIPQSQWAPGTYLLYNTSSLNNVPQSNVNMVYFDSASGPTQAFEEEDGTITITEFNTEERFISGTFEFRFIVSFSNTGETSDIMLCQNGTFTYELDAAFFD